MRDVLVIGGGPAGSATAAFLARGKVDTLLIDRARFPRSKPCAEYLSPEALRILDRLGVLATLEGDTRAELWGMRVVGPSGVGFEGRFLGSHGYRGFSPVGWAVRREQLDLRILESALDSGAEVRQGVSAVALRSEADCMVVTTRDGTRHQEIRARLVVGADGLKSRTARMLRLARRGYRRRLALTTHARGVEGMSDVGEMHVSRQGYLGLAPVGGGVTNVSVVVDLARAPAPRPTPEELWRRVSGYPAVERRMKQAGLVSRVRAVGPFAHSTRRASDHRVLLVGDAADFYDPFTGEGIYAALRGAELAAGAALAGLPDDQLSRARLARYDRMRRREFGGKWLVERLVAEAVASPRLLDRVARRMARDPALSDLMVGVTGDFVPPRKVLSPGYLMRLLW